ncbi:hypothetical protein QAD02_003248 [Eretmocerus hayati]|uniref:Uncharacterized protein n=1 Tax=Eretmocerus hayati TaxID=131215 RepID=A0ACC2NNU7_9HYME|nr:hypothetical protein QAD02_003248 [Eretmocerus hayati]
MIHEQHIADGNVSISNELYDVPPNSLNTVVNSSSNHGGVLELTSNTNPHISLVSSESRLNVDLGKITTDAGSSPQEFLTFEHQQGRSERNPNSPPAVHEQYRNSNERVTNANLILSRDCNSLQSDVSNTSVRPAVIGSQSADAFALTHKATSTRNESDNAYFENGGARESYNHRDVFDSFVYSTEIPVTNHETKSVNSDSQRFDTSRLGEISIMDDVNEPSPPHLSLSVEGSYCENEGASNSNCEALSFCELKIVQCDDDPQSVSEKSHVTDDTRNSDSSLSSSVERSAFPQAGTSTDQESSSGGDALPRKNEKKKKKARSRRTNCQRYGCCKPRATPKQHSHTHSKASSQSNVDKENSTGDSCDDRRTSSSTSQDSSEESTNSQNDNSSDSSIDGSSEKSLFLTILFYLLFLFNFRKFFSCPNGSSDECSRRFQKKRWSRAFRLLAKRSRKFGSKSRGRIKYSQCTEERARKLCDSIFKNKINGHRIVDFDHVLLETCKILDEHNGRRCKSSDWEFTGENCYHSPCEASDWQFHGESNYHGALRSLLKCRCKKCGECRGIWTSPATDDVLDLNKSAVLSVSAGGLGYAEANTLFASMNVKFMGEKSFKRHLNSLVPLLEQISEKSMLEAGEEEARLAKEAGDIDPTSGLPFTTVIVDGCWLKRSYGNQYNSLSGSGIIIGKRTGKVLYAGVRNKYCCACFRAMRNGQKAKEHDCKHNFSMKKPSTLMESEALLEGFKESVETHGLIYNKFIGDGDSNFYKILKSANPYGEWNIMPKKIECTNHLLRNFCKKIDKISKLKPTKGRKKYYYEAREVISKKVMTLRQALVGAIDRLRSTTELSSQQKVKRLKLEIENIPYHVFGDHRGCRKYKFACDALLPSAKKSINYVPYFKAYGLFRPLLLPVQKLTLDAESLLEKESNNLAENFNNVVCRYVGGKRVNYALSNQYNARISISVIQFNTHEALTYIFSNLGKKSLNA